MRGSMVSSWWSTSWALLSPCLDGAYIWAWQARAAYAALLLQCLYPGEMVPASRLPQSEPPITGLFLLVFSTCEAPCTAGMQPRPMSKKYCSTLELQCPRSLPQRQSPVQLHELTHPVK